LNDLKNARLKVLESLWQANHFQCYVCIVFYFVLSISLSVCTLSCEDRLTFQGTEKAEVGIFGSSGQ